MVQVLLKYCNLSEQHFCSEDHGTMVCWNCPCVHTQQVICAVLLSITLATALIWDYLRAAVSSSGLTVVINAMTCRALHPLYLLHNFQLVNRLLSIGGLPGLSTPQFRRCSCLNKGQQPTEQGLFPTHYLCCQVRSFSLKFGDDFNQSMDS